MKAVVFGPGRIGCGFAGQLLHDSGYDIVFVARNPVMVDHLNRTGHYRVRLVGRDGPREVVVDRLRAILSTDARVVAEEVAGADVITTSVGCGNLMPIAPLIAEGLSRREAPTNVLAFENLGNADSCLRNFVAGALGDDPAASRHGFSGALVSRIVAQRVGDPVGDQPLLFIGDSASTFIVDGLALREPRPSISGMKVTNNYQAWLQRKLFTFSAGHATAAYLGYLKGYHYIHSAIRDPEIREAVLAAMREGQKGLAATYGSEIAGDESDLLDIIARFENAALNDSVDRVGRDPTRKLGAEDRLIGPARLAKEAGVRPEKLALAAAAAMFFCNRADPSANQLRELIEATGPGTVLSNISGLDPQRTLAQVVVSAWCRLAEGWQRGNPLLSLDRFFWA